MKKSTLTRFLLVALLCLSMVFALASCSDGNEGGGDNSDQNQSGGDGSGNGDGTQSDGVGDGTEDNVGDNTDNNDDNNDNDDNASGNTDDNTSGSTDDNTGDNTGDNTDGNTGSGTDDDTDDSTGGKDDGNGDNSDTPPDQDGGEALKDIVGVTFVSVVTDYTGEVQEICASGIPEGVTASYSNNTATDAGVYEATVTLSADGYKTLTLHATLTVRKAQITNVSFPGGVFTYDGEEKILNTLEGELPEGVDVTFENNVHTDAGVYSALATLAGKNYKDLTLTAQLVIEKAVITGISLDSAEYEYDGEVKFLSLTGNLPSGVTVSYPNCENAQTEVGTYEITCVIIGRNYETLTLYAYLKITAPSQEPLSEFEGVTLEDGEFVYDGSEKSLAVTGTLPLGATVKYNGNGQKNAGVYQVSAVVSCDGYRTLFLNATMTVSKADISGVVFDDAEYTYTGEAFTLLAQNIPDGAIAVYTDNVGTNAGVYHATLTLSGDNYNTATYTAKLTVNKADFTGITLPSKTFVYKFGSVYSLEIRGKLPDGATVTYSNNSQMSVGTHKVTAVISADNYNTLILEAILTVASNGTGGGIVTPEHVFGS